MGARFVAVISNRSRRYDTLAKPVRLALPRLFFQLDDDHPRLCVAALSSGFGTTTST